MNLRPTLLLVLLVSGGSAFAANRFVDQGAPAPDREWVGHDYVELADAIKSGRITTLPTLADADGRELLQRIVNVENFRFARNTEMPVLSRLQSAIDLSRGLNVVLLAYANESNNAKKLQREVVQLAAMTLRHSVVMLDVADEFMRTLPADDPHREERAAGLRQMKNGLITVLSSAETMLSERPFYSEADLLVIQEGMAETLPGLMPILTANHRAELRGKLERRKKEFKSPVAQKHLTSMLQTLAATPKDDAPRKQK